MWKTVLFDCFFFVPPDKSFPHTIVEMYFSFPPFSTGLFFHKVLHSFPRDIVEKAFYIFSMFFFRSATPPAMSRLVSIRLTILLIPCIAVV